MMAHDESLGPEPRALTASTRTLLRDAVWNAWRAGTEPRDDAAEVALRRAIAAVASEAHDRVLRAEELVIAFKAVIAELAERDLGPSGAGARAFQSRLVTLCIKAYYGA